MYITINITFINFNIFNKFIWIEYKIIFYYKIRAIINIYILEKNN